MGARDRADGSPEGGPPSSRQLATVGLAIVIVGIAVSLAVLAAGRDDAVITLRAGEEPSGRLSYDGSSGAVFRHSYSWTNPDGGGYYSDASRGPFVDADYLEVPIGTRFTIVNPDGAASVEFAIADGEPPGAEGDQVTPDGLSVVPVGRYIVSATVAWDRGTVMFSFAVEFVDP